MTTVRRLKAGGGTLGFVATGRRDTLASNTALAILEMCLGFGDAAR